VVIGGFAGRPGLTVRPAARAPSQTRVSEMALQLRLLAVAVSAFLLGKNI